MTTVQNQKFVEQYPVRLLFNGNLISFSQFDKTFFSCPKEDGDGLYKALFLRETFEQMAFPYMSKEMWELAAKTISNNSTFHPSTSRYSSSYHTYDSKMKFIFQNRPELFFALIKTHGPEFKEWADYYNSETGEFNETLIKGLTPVLTSDYCPKVKTCKINAYDHGGNNKTLMLPVSAVSLFNGIALAAQTGATLQFTMPAQLTQEVDLQIKSAALRQRKTR